MSMNPIVGWSLSALLCWWLGKGSQNQQDDTEPESLSIQETDVGTPLPVVMGRTLIKAPLVIYFGDFRAEQYTETYAAHAKFSAWPIILSLLSQWIAKPTTGTATAVPPHSHPGGGGPGGAHSHQTKEVAGPGFLMMLAQWLLTWLINGRNLKTTMQKGFKYYLGYQMLGCWSAPGARLRAVYLGQNKVWEGDEKREDHQTSPLVITVNNEELFGGPDEGGGFAGELRFYLGGDNQGVDPWMVNQMQADSVQEELRGLTPAYRPFISMVVPTAYVGKQATIPETWLDVQIIPNRLGLGPIGDDVNPVEAIYEIMVNEDWGLGESPDIIDIDSLVAAGKKLADEKIGVTVYITQKGAARSVVDSICEHVNMVRYTNPATGKLTFKLVRDDYDLAAVPLIDESNCSSLTLTRLDWRETIGEVCVVYTDRAAQYEESSVTDNDPAVIEMNDGTKNSKTYSYKYFTNAENALWAAKREAMQQGYPLAAVTMIVNRKLAHVRTGEVVRLDYPAYGVKNMLLRVTDDDLGDFAEGKIRIDGVEDVFSLDKTEFGFSGSTDWSNQPIYPTGVQDFRYLELPWELMKANDSFVFAMAVKPDQKTQRWTIWRRRDLSSWDPTNSMTKWTAAGRLMYDYNEFTAAEDIVGFEIINLGGIEDLQAKSETTGVADIASARRGSKLLVIGDEIMAWSSLTQMPNGHWRVEGILRGVFDTVPAAHAAGDTLFFLDAGSYANVTAGGPVIPVGMTTTEDYNITTSSIDKDEDFDPAKITRLTTQRRPERPNPPGRIRMSDLLAADDIQKEVVAGDLALSWVHRNKLFSFGCVSQDDVTEYWTGTAFDPPEGTDYVIRVYVGSIKIAEYTVSESPWAYSWAKRCLDCSNLIDQTRIEIVSRVSGLESYQFQHRTFAWTIPTMVEGCVSETDANDIIVNWSLDDQIVIPKGPLAEEQHVFFKDIPLIVLGSISETEAPGAIKRQDGSWFIPDGRAIVITSKSDYELISIDAGYTFASYFVPEASGGQTYYKWDGAQMVRTGMGG